MKMCGLGLWDGGSLSSSRVMQQLLSVVYVLCLTDWLSSVHARSVRRLCKVSNKANVCFTYYFFIFLF